MKIGIDIRCLAESQYSGISEYTYNLVDHLLKIDSKNQYFLFYNSAKKTNIPKFDYSNVTYKKYSYPNKLFNLGIRFLKFTSVDKLAGDVDIFLTPSFLFTNISNRCKKILIVHDLSFDIYPEFFTFKKRLWHKLINPKKMCQQSDLIIAISENTKNDIVKMYEVNDNKIKVVYPGISQIFFNIVSEEEKQKILDKYNLPKNYALYLGNLEPRKNVSSLIKSFDLLKNDSLNLVIVGGEGWKYKKIYKVWQNTKNNKKIKFLGYIESKDKPAIYSLAKMFIYPSNYEGFGLPPIEAMACGTPVIASANSSLIEAINNAGLLIDSNNINDIAQAINYILTDQNLEIKLTELGISRAKKFNWQQKAEEILNIIKSCA